ncbi:Ig-like domain-containing protein [Schaalia naturae]|uniref:Ig-like domain-containing protein n=2 Tax=Schaalia naturae TaxID=635203 RepID=A0ABW2SLS3_9ACTO
MGNKMALASQRGSAPGDRRRARSRAALAAALAVTVAALAQPPAHATDTLPWAGDQAAGENQPYGHGYTGLDILNWSPQADEGSEYLRARVPLQERNAALAATQRDPGLSPGTQLFDLAGDYGNAFFESFQDTNVFSQYLFNYWQYTDYYASWHGMPTQGIDSALYDPGADWPQKWFEFGMLNLPNPAYTNAAHKNGVRSIGCLFFSGSDRGEQTYEDLLRDRRADGTFPVADKLVEVAQYYGFDGYFVNQESAVGADDVDAYRDFLQQMRDGGLYVQWYDSATYPNGGIGYQNAFNQTNSPWVADADKGRVSDSIFLNYWFNGSMLSVSKEHATSLGLDPYEAVFAGIEAGKDQFSGTNANALAANLDEDGTPKVSLATLGADFVLQELGDDKKTRPEHQNEAFDRERRWWTGFSQGSGTADTSWAGISSQIAERSVIGGQTFSTTFNTGHGLEWREDGAVSNSSEWGNINLQDVPVTWQWWIDAASDPLQADFDYGPDYTPASRFTYQKTGAWEGGSSLVLSGTVSSDNTIRLFKTDLGVTADSTVSVTYAKPASDDSALAVAAVFEDDPSTVVELPVADGAATDGWTTATIDLSAYAGHMIATLGLVVQAGDDAIADYQVNIGRLAVSDGADHTPATPSGLRIDSLLASTGEATVSWDIADYGSVTNYLLYLDDVFLGGRYDDHYYIKKLPAASGTLRLIAVAPDGRRSQAATLDLDTATAATDVTVTPGADGTATITWTPPATGATGATVTLETDTGSWRYASQAYSATVEAPAGALSATIEGVPVDGSRFRATVTANGVASAATGRFADATIEPPPVCDVTWSGDGATLTLARPETQDWRYLRVTEKWTEAGQEKRAPRTFRYTYSGSGDKVIRGRTPAAQYSLTREHDDSRFEVQVEDYRGVTTDPVEIPGPDDLASCTIDDPSLPDAQTSSVETVPGEAVADGSATREIRVSVKDSFGNPLTDRTVSFTLPVELSAAGSPAAAGGRSPGAAAQEPAQVAVDSQGNAALTVTSLTAGSFDVAVAADGRSLGQAAVEFAAAAAEPPQSGSEGTGGSQPGSDGSDGSKGPAAQPSGVAPAGEESSLADTGASAGPLLAVGALLLAAGAVAAATARSGRRRP